jgi:hypothetical protein
MRDILVDSKKTLLRIDEVFVFVASDADGEGVAAALAGDVFLPLVCADRARVDAVRGLAKRIARESGNKITLCRFSVREDVEVIEA